MPKPRKKGNRLIRPVLHIYCEGEKTEPIYLRGYINKFHPGVRRFKIIEIEETRKNTPVQLVDEAVKRKKDPYTPCGDEFWIVYDRESIAKYSEVLHGKAYAKAKSNSVEVALSNVCFEVWILMHLVDSNASYTSCDDLLSNSPLKEELRKRGVVSYEKADPKVFEVISSDIEVARKRADKMNKTTVGSSYHSENTPYKLNPYTRIHKLLDAIDEFLG